MSSSNGAPRLVTYFNDASITLSQAAQEDYNYVILGFLTPSSDGGVTLPWFLEGSSAPTYQQYIQTIQQANKKVMISYGGGDVDNAYYATASQDVSSLAQDIVDVVNQFGFDGVDIDYEDTSALAGTSDYDGVTFMENLTTKLASLLSGKEISHAPQIPYLSTTVGGTHGTNGYVESYIPILQSVGDKIDFLNVQFYNNPDWDGAANIVSLYEGIVAGWSGFDGWPADKMLTGMLLSGDPNSGYIPLEQFNSDVVSPLNQEYSDFGGVMGWQFSDDTDGTWASTIAQTLGLTS